MGRLRVFFRSYSEEPKIRRIAGLSAVAFALFSAPLVAQTAWVTTGDVRVTGDFDGDGQLDYGVWRPSNGTWYLYMSRNPGNLVQQQWGLPGDVPVPGDYDGDGKTDYAVWRPSNGTWFVIPSSTGIGYSHQWGLPGDLPVPGDYDGDGKTDYAVWRPSNETWFITPSSAGNAYAQQWGLPGDIPVTGDFDGSGKQEIAIWRPAEGNWYVISAKTGAGFITQWGLPGDVPVPGDYDGDGITDYAVWRPSNEQLYIIPSSTGNGYTEQLSSPTSLLSTRFAVGTFGKGVYLRVNGDYDGDGNADFALYNLATGYWFIVPTTNPSAPITAQLGVAGDVPVPGDYDNDGKTDLAIWRPSNGTWYVIPSSTGAQYSQQWGLPGDIPLAVDFTGDGKIDYTVWRPSNGTWFVLSQAATNTYPFPTMQQQWGLPGDIPIAGDFEGNGLMDFAVWRPSNGTWFVLSPSGTSTYPFPTIQQQWGLPGDVPVAGHFNDDGKTDFAVWRPSTSTWFILAANATNDYPVPTIQQQVDLNGDADIYYQAPRAGIAITSVSNSSPVPLTMLSIGTTGLTSSGSVTVKFSNSSGYSTTQQPIRIEPDGTVLVGAPLYIDPTSGQIGPGTVSLVVTDGSQSSAPVTLNVQNLPPVASYGLRPGEATHALLVFDAMLLARRINQLQAFQNLPGNKVDTTTAQSTLQTLLIATIEARHDVDKVIQDPFVAIQDETLPNGAVVQFNSNTLDTMDRVNAVFLMQTFATLPVSPFATLPVFQGESTSVQKPGKGSDAEASPLHELVSAMQTFNGVKDYTEGIPANLQATNWIDATQGAAQAAQGALDIAIGTGVQEDNYGTQTFGLVSAVVQDARTIGDAFAQDAAFIVGWATEDQALQQVAVEAMTQSEAANKSALTDLVLAFAGGPTYEAALGDTSTVASFLRNVYEIAGSEENQADQTQIDVASETQNMPSTESQDLGYVDGTVQIANSTGTAAAQTGIDLSSNGIDLNTLADPNGNYEVLIPLQNSTFNYSNTYLEAYDPVADQILVSDTIDLSSLTSANAAQAPTLTSSCIDDDDDEDDPDCDSTGQIKRVRVSIHQNGSTTVQPRKP